MKIFWKMFVINIYLRWQLIWFNSKTILGAEFFGGLWPSLNSHAFGQNKTSEVSPWKMNEGVKATNFALDANKDA